MNKDHTKPNSFTKSNANLLWGILSLSIAVFILIIMSLQRRSHNEKDQLSGILVILISVFCGLKFLIERYNLTIVATVDHISQKKLFDNKVIINWSDIQSVSLKKSPATIIVKSSNQCIIIPLTIKGWEILLELMEERLTDDKFLNFD